MCVNKADSAKENATLGNLTSFAYRSFRTKLGRVWETILFIGSTLITGLGCRSIYLFVAPDYYNADILLYTYVHMNLSVEIRFFI